MKVGWHVTDYQALCSVFEKSPLVTTGYRVEGTIGKYCSPGGVFVVKSAQSHLTRKLSEFSNI